MKVFLLLTMITFIDGKVSHREEAFVFELNNKATLSHCETYIAPAMNKTVRVDDGIDFEVQASCYLGESRDGNPKK